MLSTIELTRLLGKTVLTTVAIKHLQEVYSDRQDVAVLYLFATFDDPQSHSAKSLLASLLKQVMSSRKEIPDTLRAMQERHARSSHQSRPSSDEICNVLDEELSLYAKTFIVVDGLDEMPVQTEREELLDHLLLLAAAPNLLVTSRPLPDIQSLFAGPMDSRYCDHMQCQKSGMRLYYNCEECNYDACSICFAKSATCTNKDHALVKQYHCLRMEITAQPRDIEGYVKLRIQQSNLLRDHVKTRRDLQDMILQKVIQEAGGM